MTRDQPPLLQHYIIITNTDGEHELGESLQHHLISCYLTTNIAQYKQHQ